jgi:KDO2-lipid IV(A) lauroyltransferase
VHGSWAPAEAALARGTGVIFVFAHLGAFDAVLQLLPLRGYRSSTIGAPAGPALLQRAATALRASRGFAVEDPTPGGLRRLARALRRGEVVALAADRDFQGTGVPVRFFGAATTLPGGAVRLALATGAILVVVGCRRHGGRHTLTIDTPLTLGGSGDPALDLQRGVAAVAAALERHIAAAPEQWAMFQPVWPSALVPTPISSPSSAKESA